MAAHTHQRRAFVHAIDMALSASDIHMRPRQLKRRQVVIKLRIFPVAGVVALRAIGAVHALMRPRIILLVAAHARLWRALKTLLIWH
jgi:hypothetical protein